MKIQHALRAFTAKDRKQIKLTAENYPLSDFYETENLLTSLGMGEALITVLSEKGNPTPLAATLLQAPRSRMDVLTPQEIEEFNRRSKLVAKYKETVDRESAFEILNSKLQTATQQATASQPVNQTTGTESDQPTMIEKGAGMIGDMAKSSAGKIIIREVTRSLLGVLGFGGRTRRR